MPRQIVLNLIQGVSQQAISQRRDTQCEEQFDCLNTPSDGAAARPPTELIKAWAARDWSGAYFTEIMRGTENYLVGVKGGAPFAINLDTGVDCTVTIGAPNGYLAATPAADSIRSQVVEDTLFLANRAVSPLMSPAILSPVKKNEALIFVRSGAYSSFYYVNITGPGGNITATLGPSHASDLSQANSLWFANAAVTAIHGINGYSATASGSTVKVWRVDGQNFDLETKDGNGDEFMLGIKDSLSSYSKLPARGFQDITLEIRGENREKADNFYVKFNGPSATGTWSEIVKPGIQTTINPLTMPHLLVNTGLNTFTYGPHAWSTRIAGDEVTAKDPSFIGKKPRDIFYHENRLAVLYENGCVWSKALYPFTYFPDTAQVVLADAPVDAKLIAAISNRGATDMDFAVQIDESLFLWSPRAQYRVSSGQDNFKQDSVAAKPATAYEYSASSDPLALGQFLYFATNVGPWASLRSILFQGGRPAGGDITVSSHVPKYIPAGVRWITASDTLSTMFIATDGDKKALYVFNFLFEDGQYLQSGHNKWRLPGGDVLWAGVAGNYLRILLQRGADMALVKVNLTPKAVDTDLNAGYLTRLDMRVNETQVTGLVYNAGTNRTSFSLPYNANAENDTKVVLRLNPELGTATRGKVFPVVSRVDNVVTVEGNLAGLKFYAGSQIDARRTDSRVFLRDAKTGTTVPVKRLTVDRFGVTVADTGYTRIEVNPVGRDFKSYPWEPRYAGVAGGQSGTPQLGSDDIEVPIGMDPEKVTITLVNDSFLPSYWQSAYYDLTAVPGGQG